MIFQERIDRHSVIYCPEIRGTSSKLHLYKKDDPKNVQIPTQECELLLFMIIDFGEVIYCSYIKDGVRLDKLLTRMGLYLLGF